MFTIKKDTVTSTTLKDIHMFNGVAVDEDGVTYDLNKICEKAFGEDNFTFKAQLKSSEETDANELDVED